MASTSTGYNKSIISREQPTSSGQVMSFTSGCILNVNAGAKTNISGKVEINSGSTVDIESGGRMTVASGGRFAIEAGGIFAPSPVSQITSCGVYGTTLTFGGAYWLNPTSSGNITVQISQPLFAGQRTIFAVSNSSKKKARIIVGNTLCQVGATSGQQIVCSTASVIGTNKIKGFNRHVVELMAMTTVKIAIIQPASTLTVGISLSSGRTS